MKEAKDTMARVLIFLDIGQFRGWFGSLGGCGISTIPSDLYSMLCGCLVSAIALVCKQEFLEQRIYLKKSSRLRILFSIIDVGGKVSANHSALVLHIKIEEGGVESQRVGKIDAIAEVDRV